MTFSYFSAALLFLLCFTEMESCLSKPRKGRSQQAASFLAVLSLPFPVTLLKTGFPLGYRFLFFSCGAQRSLQVRSARQPALASPSAADPGAATVDLPIL